MYDYALGIIGHGFGIGLVGNRDMHCYLMFASHLCDVTFIHEKYAHMPHWEPFQSVFHS
jgi:hypothetical protein